ncbi:unnamed protein product [Arctia plantaginis]|uniref:Uncharacterized protein n=1 Tax=Arctia plantaginis TaxID=874455 RepID=A0A8S0ZMT0_ARCPL|nr:unnamed protein product [Arctia plantaginis]
MRNHFEYELFRFPPFSSHFNPRDHSFGPFGGSRAGWPNFNRPGCRPHGPPGFTNCHGPPHHRQHDRHRSPSPPREVDDLERPRTPDHGHHGGRHERCKSPGHHGFSRCCRERQINHHGENERCSWGHGMPCGPGKGPKRGHHHHHWSGLDHHGFGPRFCRRGFFDRFGPDHCEPHCGPRFGHRRPGPYGRPAGCTECEDCESEPCCSGNKDTRASKKPGAMRKENKSCCAKDKDQDEAGDTVLVQRIIVERAPTRPKSV